MNRVVQRDAALATAGFLFGLFAIPVLVFSGGSLLLAAVLAVAAVSASLASVGSPSPAIRALAWAGFVMGAGSLWYTITGWAVSLDIAEAIGSLF